MLTEIGIVAGEIWHYLDQHESANLNELAKAIDQPREVILMSLGWLAREGHINLDDQASGFRSCLKKSSKA